MPTPAFILTLREKIGHDLLWLVGVTAYVEDDQGRALLGRRADTGEWALISGTNEPGEEPADTVAREVAEEAGVAAEVMALAGVKAGQHVVTYANGDKTQYLELVFLCRAAAGVDARVGDEENLAVGWFAPDALPKPLSASARERLELVARYRRMGAGALFVSGGELRSGALA